MTYKLKNLANVQLGYNFRSRIISQKTGAFKVIQLKDLNEYHQLKINTLDRIDNVDSYERYKVDKGDILFLSRGNNSYAHAVTKSLKNTITVSYFYIIRPYNEAVLSEYIAWYINSKNGQAFINLHKTGSFTAIVRKSDIEEMELEVPPLDIQEKIVKLSELWNKERELCKELEKKRAQLIEAVCLKNITD